MTSRVPGAAHRDVADPVHGMRRLAGCCGTIVLALGLTVLGGWCAHSVAIERIASGLPAMTALTAIALCFGAAAMLCLGTCRLRRAGRVLGGAMAVVGLLVVVEYLVAPIGIDQLLFRASSGTDPGRPAPQTAVCLLLLGSALASVGSGGRRRWLHYAVLAVASVIVLFVTVGYLFGIIALRGVSGSDGVALHTLVGLILLTVGTGALAPDDSLLRLLRGRGTGALVARAAVALGLAPVIAGAVLLALLSHGVLEPRVALTLLTVTMIVFLALVGLPLIVKVSRAEASTRELTGRLEALFDNAPAALSLRDIDGRYLHINRYGAAIVGQRPEELIGQIPPGPSAVGTVSADDREIAQSGESVAHEQLIEHADGALRDYHVVRYPVFEDGEVRAFGTFAVDITEQKRIVYELELAQARFRSAFDEAPIGMMLQTLDGTVQQVNPALCQLVGRSEAELLADGVRWMSTGMRWPAAVS